LSPRIRLLIEDLRSEWRALDERIAAFDAEFVRMAREDEAVRRLTTIPGIGTINATALAAAVGNARAFRRGRDMAAWLGLTPRQVTTGGKPPCSASASAVIAIFERISFMAREPCCLISSSGRRLLAGGPAGCWREHTKMLSLLRWPTSWRASPGRSWRMAAPMTPAAIWRPHKER